MAGVGGSEVHWEARPIGQLVFFYIFVFKERAGPIGPVGSEGWWHRRKVAGPRWLGERGARPVAWPDRAGSVFNERLFFGRL